jgi:hypothetical protein
LSNFPSTWSDVQLGKGAPISAASSGLDGYVSPNEQKESQIPDDQAALEEIRRLRGSSTRDEEVHKVLSSATRKNYEVNVGIPLEIPDPVGGESHEIRYWEISKNCPTVSSANELYVALAQKLSERSLDGALPIGIP